VKLFIGGIKLYILEVKSLEDLKLLGKHRDLVTQFKEIIGKGEKVNTKSWQNLYASICYYNNNIKKPIIDQYFISKEAEVIFYLVELSGESRLKMLGLTKSYYLSKAKATKWRNSILKLIHPDKCLHQRSNEATIKLNSIYKEMIGNEK